MMNQPPRPAPLDFTQRIEHKLARYNSSQNICKRWLFEIACWMISAASLGSVVGIYIHISDTRLADQSNLLTLANILGKIASAALIVPTTEALGQLKWNWFHDSSKAMWDFEIFDKATRGPWGAAMLLYRTKGRSLAALGALLVVLLLAIDSFLQQVVDLPDRWSLQHGGITGDLSRTIRYEPGSNLVLRSGAEIASDSPDLFPVTRKFAYGNGTEPLLFGNGTRPEIPVVSFVRPCLPINVLTRSCTQSCPTSNCSWPLYETLGVCSKCSDITEYLTFACLTSKIDWLGQTMGGFGVEWSYPTATHCGYFLNATTDDPILMSGYIVQANATDGKGEVLLHRNLPLTSMTKFTPLYGNGSLLFKNLRNTIVDAMIVSSPDGTADAVYRNETPKAQECVLTWCVKSVRSTFAWGGYHEEIIDKYFNTTSGPFAWDANYTVGQFENYTDLAYREAVNIELSSTVYGVSNATAFKVNLGFMDVFPSMTTALNATARPQMRHKIWNDGDPWLMFMDFNPWMAPNSVTQHMERMATAFTNTIRSVKDSQVSLHGDAYAREVFVHINWAWLAFPFTLLSLTLLFLALTIVKTSKESEGAGIWKTSAMPALIYGLPKEAQDRLEPCAWRNAHSEHRRVRIRLSSRVGWRVSGQELRRPSSVLPLQKVPPGWI